ncbi:MAG: DUF262 domain-containing HNH endonuclease family protein [Bacilli bacterium]|nr:DUF262 domain-containing HNH endonuclease family protein [Bacilli bacterium]
MKINNDKIDELYILEKEKSIFDKNMDFIIPIYQRSYEWEEEQIDRLFEDIMDFKEKTYYLGIMVTHKNNDGKYEIIDGQQRLTTLYIILKCLNLPIKDTLHFSLREKSTKTLKDLNKLIDKKEISKQYDISIIEKAKYINETIKQIDKDKLKQKLERTKLILTEVPEKTDLNHYFEIMNTRGEQLLNTDIIKSRLLNFIDKNDETKGNIKRKIFSEIWEACSDMNSYVQMNFTPEIRRKIFGDNWNKFIINSFDELYDNLNKNIEFQPKTCSINDIKNNTNNYKKIIEDLSDSKEGIITKYEDKDKEIKYESIIKYPIFLLHILKVFVREEIKPEYNEDDILNDLLDENKLIESFEKVIKNLDYLKLNKKNPKEDFSLKFIYLLLKSRYLFDSYILKRKYTNENKDGQWSIDILRKSSSKSPTWKSISKNSIMMQAALRVSYTSPKVMHWITEALQYLNTIDNINNQEYEDKIEEIIINNIINIIKDFNKSKDNNNYTINKENNYFYEGVDIHHILFNYLDYLLWKNNKEKQYNKFEFEFRNSVEHFYPRNPKGFDEWKNKKELNYFGNLCLVSKSFNSELSNDAPSAKVASYKNQIDKGSLKLRIMASYIKTKDDNKKWKEQLSKEHGDKMLEILLKKLNQE